MGKKTATPPEEGAQHKTHPDYINFLGLGNMTKKRAAQNTLIAVLTAVFLLVVLAFMFAGLAV